MTTPSDMIRLSPVTLGLWYRDPLSGYEGRAVGYRVSMTGEIRIELVRPLATGSPSAWIPYDVLEPIEVPAEFQEPWRKMTPTRKGE